MTDSVDWIAQVEKLTPAIAELSPKAEFYFDECRNQWEVTVYWESLPEDYNWDGKWPIEDSIAPRMHAIQHIIPVINEPVEDHKHITSYGEKSRCRYREENPNWREQLA